MLIATLILLLFIIGVLLAPVSLHLHSLSQEAYVNVWNIFYARFLLIESEPAVRLSLFTWNKTLFLLRPKRSREAQIPKTGKAPRKKWKRPSFLTLERLKRILSSFKIREFYMNIDTRDVVWNAYLFPVSAFLLDKGYPVRINFLNQFHLDLVIENRLGSLLMALILSFF